MSELIRLGWRMIRDDGENTLLGLLILAGTVGFILWSATREGRR